MDRLMCDTRFELGLDRHVLDLEPVVQKGRHAAPDGFGLGTFGQDDMRGEADVVAAHRPDMEVVQ